MASAAYYRWVKDGAPYRDAICLLDLARTLRAAGYVVYTRGDDAHMQAVPPEDHTAVSSTGWPVKSAYGVGHALDVMPPPKTSRLPTLAQLGAQIVADRSANVAGTKCIKYINWTDKNGRIVQDSWTPDHEQGPSNDSGHIHLSVRSDMDDTHTDYDPVARILGETMTPQELLSTKFGSAGLGVAPRPLADWLKDGEAARQAVVALEAKVDALTATADALLALATALTPQPAVAITYTASGNVTLTPPDAPPGP